ncbi:Gag-protease-like protein [Plakobranchus ocellatus]|uniref:Gag-protease-like protein n=1 Tax=Plakobranchus ocellatus TaxID=259542 RepID=A0AAV3Z073_9GAST|nr:Gag-protease-like protein [Plakobranchus ocellatus]
MNKAGTTTSGNDQSRSVAPLQQVKKKKFAPEPSKRICKQCGSEHRPRQCPAYGKTCHKCKGKNHFATVCRSGQKNKTPHKTKVHEVEIGSEEKEQHFWVGELETDKGKRWSVNAKVCDTEIKMKVDIGAETSTIPAKLWEKIKRKPRLRE